MIGLLCTGLISYIVAESEREKAYQKKIVDVVTEIHNIGVSATPFRTVSLEDRYNIGTEIAKSANERIVLFAGSLILLTGSKPYLESQTVKYELEQDILLRNLAKKASETKKIRFLCSFSPDRLFKEIEVVTRKHQSDRFINAVLGRLNVLENYHKKSGSSFEMRQIKNENDGSYFIFMVGDDRFALWLKNAITKGHDLCITGTDHNIADNLVWLFMDLTTSVDYKALSDIMQEAASKGLQNIGVSS